MTSTLIKTLIAASIGALCVVQPAAAKNASLHHPQGSTVQIKCAKKLCFVKHTNAFGRSGGVRSAGPATTVNFVRLVKTWQSKGYR